MKYLCAGAFVIHVLSFLVISDRFNSIKGLTTLNIITDIAMLIILPAFAILLHRQEIRYRIWDEDLLSIIREY